MFALIDKKRLFHAAVLLLAVAVAVAGCFILLPKREAVATGADGEGGFIKWVDFNVPYQALDYAIKLDIKYHDSDTPMSFIELLAYQAAKNGNSFKGFKTAQLDAVADKLKAGQTMAELTANMDYYTYYFEAFTAALSGLVGTYEIEVPDETSETGKRWERKYGIKAFSPIAKGYYYSHCDDFGVGRSYGFKRRHLGHDMMSYIGTPIIAVESGTVEELGWNQYGGWRIGIRSHDKKRYYYYAHLRKGFPYNKSLKIGSEVLAGDVIGYMGRTGYSLKEDVNGMNTTHLHIGLELIFDESQKECNNEIWIDIYPMIQLLYRNKSAVVKNQETKEYNRVYGFREVPEE